MKKTFCDQCGSEIGSHSDLPMHLTIYGNQHRQFEINRDLELCERCYHGWTDVIRYVSKLDGFKDLVERSREL